MPVHHNHYGIFGNSINEKINEMNLPEDLENQVFAAHEVYSKYNGKEIAERTKKTVSCGT
jgi:hypothetical protein